MKILYASHIILPNKRAHSIQAINTCFALAEKGASVLMLVGGNLFKKSLYHFYGIKPTKNLKVLRLPCSFSFLRVKFSCRILFDLLCVFIIHLLHKKIDCILLRDDLTLFKRLFKFVRPKVLILFETHSIHYLSTQERGNRSVEKIKKIRKIEAEVYKSVDGIIAITSRLKRALCAEFQINPERIEAIPSGVRKKEFNSPQNKRKDIYYVGHLYPTRGVSTLVEAMKYIDDAKLIIIGGLQEDIKRLKSFLRRIGVSKKIIIKGFIQPNRIREHLREAAVGVIPLVAKDTKNAHFASPLKLFEYMSMKVPIVASNLPSIREVLKDGVDALLVEPENPEALAEGIKRVLRCKDLAKLISENAYQKVKRYTYEERAKRILEFIEKLKRKK